MRINRAIAVLAFSALLLTACSNAPDTSTKKVSDHIALLKERVSGKGDKRIALKLQITILSSDILYLRKDSGYYSASKLHMVTETKFVHGAGPSLDGTVQRTTRDTLPDPNAGGYFRLNIIDRDDQHFMRTEIRDRMGTQMAETTSEGEIEPIKGTWEDFEAGKTVQLLYTPSGLASVQEDIERQFSTEIAAPIVAGIKEQLRKGLAINLGVPEQELTTEHMDEVFSITADTKVEIVEMPNEPIQANLERVSIRQNQPTIMNMDISIVMAEK